LWVLLATTALTPRVDAFTGGSPPSQVVQETVFGSALVIGNTLMEHDGTVNFAVKPTGSMQTVSSSRMPVDATVVRAFLLWSGSEGMFGTDRDIDLRLPDGTFFNDLSVDFPTAGEPASALNRCLRVDSAGNTPVPYYSCRREVTHLLQQLGPGGALGTYEVSDVDLQAGDCNNDPFCQAMYGGWALVIMWESPTESVRRDLVLYDAFFAVDEQDFSAGTSPQFTLDGFLVGPSEEGEITVIGFEGDAALGVPPQDNPAIPNGLFCTTCDDFVALTSTSGGGTTRLSDATNAEGNLFNGSNNTGGGPHPGLDIDTFDLGPAGLNVLREGDTTLRMQVGSGDGVPGGDAGGGELVFLGASLLSFETFSPRFSGVNTEKVVVEPVAGGGETLNYILRVENDGSADATNVVITDQLPANVVYLPGTTTNTCGVGSTDVGGTSPVLAPGGLNIGTVDVNERCEIRFKAAVVQGTADGTVLNNFFTIAADGIDDVVVGPATTLVESAAINTATKSVSVLGGGPPIPGATLVYAIRVENDGGRAAPEVAVVDSLPAELEFLSVLSSPPGSINNSDGAGNIDINAITIAGNSFAEVTIAARIRPTVTAGTLITNQATVTQPSLPGPLLTDDPAQPGTANPTRITVASDISLTNSTKSVVDLNGGSVVPGDVLRYTIRVDQGAGADLVVDVDDDLPPHVGGCALVSAPAGSTVACAAGGANGTGQLTGSVPVSGNSTATVVFDVTVSTVAPDGAVIQNQANLVPQSSPTEDVTVVSPSLTVVARPTFVASSKGVLDENGGGVRPGDFLTYTITVDNAGPAASTNTVVTDDIDSNLAVVPGSITSGGTLSGSRITWNLGAVGAFSQQVLTFRVQVNGGVVDGTTISNSASIRADAPAENAVAGPVDVVVQAAPTLALSKEVVDVNGAPAEPGDVLRYTMTLTNTGDGAADDVVVTAPISSLFAEVQLLGQGRVVGSDVIFDDVTVAALSSVAPGDVVVLTYDARVVSMLPNGTAVSSQANVRADQVAVPVNSDDPATAAPFDATTVVITSAAALEMSKVAIDVDGGALQPGDRVEVVLQLQNVGNAPADNVEVRDALDANLAFDGFSSPGTVVGNEVVFSSAQVPQLAQVASDAVELRFFALVDSPLPDGTLIPNQATVSSTTAPNTVSDDPNTAAALDPTVLRVESRPVLDNATKTVVDVDGDGVFEPGDVVRYVVHIENEGNEDAANVRIEDVVDVNLTDISATGTGAGVVVIAGQTVTFIAGTVPVGESRDLTIEATVTSPIGNGVLVANQARITQDGQPDVVSDDPNTAALDDSTDFAVTSHPVLAFTKAVVDDNGGAFEPGDDVTYTLRLQNTGGRAATQVRVDDTLPAELTNLVLLDGGALVGNTATWTSTTVPALASLDVGDVVSVRVRGTLQAPLPNGTLVQNQASASLGEAGVPGFPWPSDNPTTPIPDDSTDFQVVADANLAATTLESTDENGLVIATARPADAVHLELHVRNSGTATATNVVVRVPVPDDYVVEDTGGGILQGNEVVFTAAELPGLASVAPGDDLPVVIRGRLAFPLADGTVVSWQARVLADGVVFPFVSDDPSTATASDATQVVVESDADLTIAKTFIDLNDGQVEPGDVIQYVLVVDNTGDGPARNVIVRDPLPAELEFVSSTSGGFFVGGEVVFTSLPAPALAEVQPTDAPIELRFEARVRDGTAAGTLVSNQALAQSDNTPDFLSDDPSTAASRDPTRFEVFTNPRLALSKDVVGGAGRVFAPGDVLTYTFTVTSVGTAPSTPADFVDVVPASLVSVTPGPGLVFNTADRTLRGLVPALAVGAQQVFTMTATVGENVTNGTVVENQAQVEAADIGVVQSDDPITPAEGDATIGIVEAMPVLTTSSKVAIDENGGVFAPGDVVRYDITLHNTGNGRARDITVSDALSTDAFIVEEVLQGGAVSGNVVTWNTDTTPALADLAPGASVQLTVRARLRSIVVDGTLVSNQANIQSSDVEGLVRTDDPSTPAAGDATNFVVSAPRLVFEKSIDINGGGTVLTPGVDVQYILRLRNDGSTNATNVVITDLLPTELVDVTVSSGGVVTNGQAQWDASTTNGFATLGPGQQLVVTIDATVDPLALGGTEVRNQASARADEVGLEVLSDDPDTALADDATTREVRAEENFTGSVSLFDADTDAPLVDDVVPDQRVRARIRLTNAGTQASQAVFVRVPLPSSLFRAEEANLGGVVDTDGVRWSASQDDIFRVILPGDSVNLELVGTIAKPIADGTVIDVQAEVSSVTTEAPFIIGPAQMSVRSRPDLSASTKTVTDENGGVVEPGDVLTWRITVINDGGAVARDVRLFDATPSATTYVPGSLEVAGDVVNGSTSNPLAAGFNLGNVSAGRAVVVAFQTRVSRSALRGLRVENQGVLVDEDNAQWVTDNPATPSVPSDATAVLIGGGPLLVASKTATPTRVDVGGVVTYTIAVENGGSDLANDVALEDVIQAPATYVANSARVDGVGVTDAADADGFDVVVDGNGQSVLSLDRDVLEAGEGILLTFDVTATSAPLLVNQGSVRSLRVAPQGTDGDPLAAGAQETLVPVGNSRMLLIEDDTVSLIDDNGDVLQPGDVLRGTVTVRNRSDEDVRMTSMSVSTSQLLQVDEDAFGDDRIEPIVDSVDNNVIGFRLAEGAAVDIAANSSVALPFVGRVAQDAILGDLVRVLVDQASFVSTDGALTAQQGLGDASLRVGMLPGTGALQGVLYADHGERNGVFDPGDEDEEGDLRISGFQVHAFLAGQPDGEPVRTAVTNDDGEYRLTSLPAGAYRLQVRSSSGAVFMEKAYDVEDSAYLDDEHLRIDPSGVVYNSTTMAPVRGQQVFLYVDDGDGDLSNDVLVADDQLPEGQQGQVTGPQGLYRFDPFAGDYRVDVVTDTPLLAWPSTAIPVTETAHPLGPVAEPAADGTVVAHAAPSRGLETTYFLRFALSPERPPVLNNHIPVDGLRDGLSITKSANRRQLTMGDLVAYTVTLQNKAGAGLSLDDGGVEFVDTLPEGFVLVPDAWDLHRIRTDRTGQRERTRIDTATVEGSRILRFGRFALEANATYELRYQVVVGPGTPRGDLDNRALLRTAEGQLPLTTTAIARVRVVDDPMFDLGSLRASVYCDDDGDDVQDVGERGVMGARVYLDTGSYAEADPTGKLHFSAIPPGMHLVKLDERTLPFGVNLNRDARANFYISPGLPAQVEFAATCTFAYAEHPAVVVNESVYRGPDAPPLPTRDVEVTGQLNTADVSLDGVALVAPHLDLGVSANDDEPAFGLAKGPNLALADKALRETLVLTPRVTSSVPVASWQVTVLSVEMPEQASDAEDAGAPDGGSDTPTAVDAGATDVDAGTAAAASDAGEADDDEGLPMGSRLSALLGRGASTDDASPKKAPEDGGVVTDAGAVDDAGGADAGADAGAPNVEGAKDDLVDSTGVKRAPVWVFAGEGPPPEAIRWDGMNPKTGVLVVDGNTRYEAVLSVLFEGGDESASVGRPFGVAVGAPQSGSTDVAVDERIDASDGKLFSKKGPTARLKAWVQSHRDVLLSQEGAIVVEVHAGGNGDGQALNAQTATEAQQVAQLLGEAGVPRDRVDAKGMGADHPRVPNLRRADRLKNRRVVLRVEQAPLRYAPLAAIRGVDEVWVNGQPVDVDDVTAPFGTVETVALGSVLHVEVRSSTAGRRAFARAVVEGPFAPTNGAERDPNAEVAISGSIADRAVKLGDRDLSLAVLDSKLTPVHTANNGRAVGVVHDDGAEMLLKPSVPEGVEVAHWRFRVVRELSPSTSSKTEVAPPKRVSRFVPAAPLPADPSADAASTSPTPNPTPAANAGAALRRTLFEQEGQGALPDELSWDGRNAEGDIVVEPGQTVLARLIFTTQRGDKAVSSELPVLLLTSLGSGDAVAFEKTLTNPYSSKGKLKRRTRRALRKMVKELNASDQRVVVKVHSDDSGPRLTRRTRSQRIADATKAVLVKAGVDAQRITALGIGSDEPLAPNITSRNKKKNRRIEVKLELPPNIDDTASPPPTVAKVVANGRALDVDDQLAFVGAAPASRTGEISLLVRTPEGARALLQLREAGEAFWQGRPEALLTRARHDDIDADDPLLGPPLGPLDAGVVDPMLSVLTATPTAEPDAGVDGGQASMTTGDGGVDADGGGNVGGDAGAVAIDGGRAADAGAATPKADAVGPIGSPVDVTGVVDAGAGPQQRVRVPYAAGDTAPGWWPYVDEVPAAQLKVALPPETEPLRSAKLWVHGETLPDNRVRVRGQPVVVDEQGRFAVLLEMQNGNQPVVVEVEDIYGNTAKIERLYVVDTTGWFVMLFGEGVVGQKGALQDERTKTTSVEFGDFFAHGRGVAYIKGDMNSPYVFRDIDVTLHLDNRRWEDGIFARNLQDPDRFMPAFGDSSVEIQEVQALYPIFVEAKADHSHAKVGNIKTRVEGGDLFRYTRSRYGLELELDRGWSDGLQLDLSDPNTKVTNAKADPWRTRVKGFGSVGAADTRHARVELMGTGGSLYYLRHQNLIEGSERVSLVVRDAISGSEIARTLKQRNVDYTIRYGEGRVLFNEPIPAFVDNVFGLNHNLGQVQAGHRVFVEVEYDHNALEPFQGIGGGAQLKQTLFGHLEVGGGYLLEAREDGSPAYQLGGMHAKLFLDDNTWLKGEWAWSSSVDAGNYMSLDGGLTYAKLGQGLDDDDILVGNQVLPAARQGFALKLEGQALFGQFLGGEEHDASIRGWAQHQSPGFFAGAAIVEQGQTKWGLDGAWRITSKDKVRLRYDSVLSDIPVVPHAGATPFATSDDDLTRQLHRHMATVQYQRNILQGLDASAELGYAYTFDSGLVDGSVQLAEQRDIHTTAAAMALDWQALERLHLGFKQEVIFTGDDKQLQSWNDHLISHASVRFLLTDRLSVNLTESLRWNGENQTQLGLSWQVNDKARVYASERIGLGDNGWSNATVLGGETDLAPGSKMYAEYQLTSAFSANSSRGVVGITNQWKLPFGFSLNFGYERTQMMGGAQTTTATVAPGAFTDNTFFAAPGKNLGGSALMGNGSRDAGWTGLEYTRGDTIRASQRFELRYDNFDESRGGHDRVWFTSLTNAMWKITPEFSMLARYNFALAQDMSRGQIEARMEEGVLGVAYRPVTHDWISVWAKLKRRSEVRPISLSEGRVEDYTTHALSLEPIVELPWDLQLVEKVAVKHASQTIDDLPRADAVTGLWINRVNWHVLRTIRRFDIDPLIPGDIDIGVEYRFLGGMPAFALEHGALVEVQIAPVPYFRVGLGWNFTSFTDDELSRNDRDESGFFVRAIGQY